jgi:hypothetical protein
MSDMASFTSLGLGVAQLGIQKKKEQTMYETLRLEIRQKNIEALRVAQMQRSQEQNQGSAIGQFLNRGLSPWPTITTNQQYLSIMNPSGGVV